MTEITTHSTPVAWRPLANEGADLPPATVIVRVGETFDARVTLGPEEYLFVVSAPNGPPVYRRLLPVR